MRVFFTPRWLGLHLLLVVCVTVMGRMGIWQWQVAHTAPGGWQNYGYAVQWLLFAGFAVFMWVKLVLDELDPHRDEADQVPDPQLREAPPLPEVEGEDDELAAYNRYLRELHERSRA